MRTGNAGRASNRDQQSPVGGIGDDSARGDALIEYDRGASTSAAEGLDARPVPAQNQHVDVKVDACVRDGAVVQQRCPDRRPRSVKLHGPQAGHARQVPRRRPQLSGTKRVTTNGKGVRERRARADDEECLVPGPCRDPGEGRRDGAGADAAGRAANNEGDVSRGCVRPLSQRPRNGRQVGGLFGPHDDAVHGAGEGRNLERRGACRNHPDGRAGCHRSTAVGQRQDRRKPSRTRHLPAERPLDVVPQARSHGARHLKGDGQCGEVIKIGHDAGPYEPRRISVRTPPVGLWTSASNVAAMMTTDASANPFRAAVEAGDLDAAAALLHPDVVFRSPVVHVPYAGKAACMHLLGHVFEVFQDFRYTDELSGDRVHGLVFETNVDGKDIQGWDYLTLDANGMITEFAVMIRPLSGLIALATAMGARLAEDPVPGH